MKVALVHDYLREYGGAERVLLALSNLWPDAPIYTAFAVSGSTAAKAFSGKKIVSSWFGWIPGLAHLYSPLRFLIPWIWGGFDFSGYDLVISSASWYITKGLGKKFNVPEICYCHTPPRWLYGYPTSINFQKYWPVKVYALIVGHFLRMYDFNQAQKVDVFVANSQEVANRITKFYRRDSEIVYPPIDMVQVKIGPRQDYFLVLSRLVGAKGVEMAVEASRKTGIKLKIAGESVGFGGLKNVETLGYVSEEEKARLMGEAKAFLALEENVDFGMTPVEAMAMGTPVIAFNGGGYKETVVDGKTGVLFDDYSTDGLIKAIGRFNRMKWNTKIIKSQAQNFSLQQFQKKMIDLAQRYARITRNRNS
ncbi:MAG: glycosyltransferase [bacterium]|nr:glycosyltransferase [bacterium]